MVLPERERSTAELAIIDRVRAITATLYGVNVSINGFGHTTFKAAKKMKAPGGWRQHFRIGGS